MNYFLWVFEPYSNLRQVNLLQAHIRVHLLSS